VATKEQIERLKAIEKVQNKGRGVCCVRDIIMFLEKGMDAEALGICRGENDKIRNYPDVQVVLYEIFPEYKADFEKLRKLFGW